MKSYFLMVQTFKNMNELTELIEYFRNNECEKNDISEKFMQVYHKYFKYTDAAKMIISHL